MSSASTQPQFEQLAENLYCIDALYTAPSIACCYLLGDGEEFAMIVTETARSVGYKTDKGLIGSRHPR